MTSAESIDLNGNACWSRPLNLRARRPSKKITRRSDARCENVITPAVSGPMPTAATQLAAGSRTPALRHTHTG